MTGLIFVKDCQKLKLTNDQQAGVQIMIAVKTNQFVG